MSNELAQKWNKEFNELLAIYEKAKAKVEYAVKKINCGNYKVSLTRRIMKLYYLKMVTIINLKKIVTGLSAYTVGNKIPVITFIFLNKANQFIETIIIGESLNSSYIKHIGFTAVSNCHYLAEDFIGYFRFFRCLFFMFCHIYIISQSAIKYKLWKFS